MRNESTIEDADRDGAGVGCCVGCGDGSAVGVGVGPGDGLLVGSLVGM